MLHSTERERGFSLATYLATQAPDFSYLLFLSVLNKYIPPKFTKMPRKTSSENIGGFDIVSIEFADCYSYYFLCALEIPPGDAQLEKSKLTNRQVALPQKPQAVLPLGPIKGKYRWGKPVETKFIFYASDGEEPYGSNKVVNRFYGLEEYSNEDIENYSGGLIVEHGDVSIVNQSCLQKAADRGAPAVQTFFSFNRENVDRLLTLKWHHFHLRQAIGNSPHGWNWYLKVHSTPETTYFVSPLLRSYLNNSNFPFCYIKEISDALAQGQNWSAAVVDSGSVGGGVVIHDGEGHAYSTISHPELCHTAPLHLVVKKKQFP